MSRYGKGALGTAATGIAKATLGTAPSGAQRIGPYRSRFSTGNGLHASGGNSGPSGIHPLCLDYFHFLALYHPQERGRLGEALVTYTNADPDVINECALALHDEMARVAAARGVSIRDIKREFKELKKRVQIPDAKQLNKSRTVDAEKRLVSSYSRLGYPTPEAQQWYANTTAAASSGDAVAMAELDEAVPGPSETAFGGLRLRWPRPRRPASGRMPRWWTLMQKVKGGRTRGSKRTARRIAKGKAGRGVSLFGWTP